jgi:hypothetical protein
VDLVDAGMLGKVDLPPAFGPAQLPDSLASRNADVPCHPVMFGLVFALYLVHPLSSAEGADMNRISAFLLLCCCTVCLAQTPQIKSGATVYIEPMDGYESYLAAAFMKKHVPLIVVADKDKAEYIISGNVAHKGGGQPAVVVNNSNTNVANGNANGDTAFNRGVEQAEARKLARGATSASIAVIDAKSSQIVYAYSVGKNANTNQVQSTAEACAKHLREFIDKAQK